MIRKISRDGLVIEDNTIYEIDMECYACMNAEERRTLFHQDEMEQEQQKNGAQ